MDPSCFFVIYVAAVELLQLEILVAVAEERTLHQAAGRLCRTKQTVSAAIRELEAEVGILLFEQSNSSELYLTDAGEELVKYARSLRILHDEALAAVEKVRNNEVTGLKSFGHAQ